MKIRGKHRYILASGWLYCPGIQTTFTNGLLCKTRANISASDFKSTILRNAGDTDNFLHSAVSTATAVDFPGLNTLGLSVARTDLEVDGIVLPHYHPRATEMFFVYKGTVFAGFIDTHENLFQEYLKEGDVMVFPRGLLHFCFNDGEKSAVAYSVLNSQNPGVVSSSDSIFGFDSDVMNKIARRLVSAHEPNVKMQ